MRTSGAVCQRPRCLRKDQFRTSPTPTHGTRLRTVRDGSESDAREAHTAQSPPPSEAPPRASLRRTAASRRAWAGWGFLAPFATVFVVVFVAPILYSLYLSLYRDQLVGGTSFVGV